MIGWLTRWRRDPGPWPAGTQGRVSRPPQETAAARAGARALSALLGEHGPSPDPGTGPSTGPCTALETRALAALDARLTPSRLGADLLPPAPEVVAPLLRALRMEVPSRSTILRLVDQHEGLAAEVMQVALSPLYRDVRTRVESLAAAVAVLGTAGLRCAMARAVLRPLFVGRGDGTAAALGPALWQRAEAKALRCAQLAAAAGADLYDAYAAGLLHDAGWMAVLRALDDAGIRPAVPFSREFDEALGQRRDRLFARLALEWRLTPALSALTEAAATEGVATAPAPLGPLLCEAERQLDGLGTPQVLAA